MQDPDADHYDIRALFRGDQVHVEYQDAHRDAHHDTTFTVTSASPRHHPDPDTIHVTLRPVDGTTQYRLCAFDSTMLLQKRDDSTDGDTWVAESEPGTVTVTITVTTSTGPGSLPP